ncbi:MAG TPA: FUSC family membrane protein, partial [Labilithrix sp.]|nr:FUSC family membrane protein [Labilithrix sp.]
MSDRASRAADARYDALLPALANGVRAAVATLVPFFLAAALGRAELGWMALGGWLGTLADPGGLRSTRLKALAAFAIVGAVMVPISERCGGSIALATLLLGVVAFGATLARALGPAAASAGTMTAVLVAVGTAKGGGAYLADALSFAAGAVWATLLSSLVWPVGPHRPVRRAIAEVFAALAEYARAIDAIVEDAEAGERWASLARTHQRRVRAAIEAALAIALAVRARRPGESSLGADLRVLLGAAEEQFPQLIALSEELEALAPKARPLHVRRRLREIAATYDETRRQVLIANPSPDGAPRATRLSRPDDEGAAGLHSARLVKDSEHARALAGSLGQGAVPPGREERERPAAMALGELRELRDALALESVFFRHALRVAFAVTVASLVGHRFSTH